MIDNWPDPYPDELFYTICARYLEQVRFSSRPSPIAELFGAEHTVQKCKFEMPVNKLLRKNEHLASDNKQQAGGAIDDR